MPACTGVGMMTLGVRSGRGQRMGAPRLVHGRGDPTQARARQYDPDVTTEHASTTRTWRQKQGVPLTLFRWYK